MQNHISQEFKAGPVELVSLMSEGPAKAFATLRGPGAEAARPYSGFSVCTYTGDSPAHSGACLAALAARTGIDTSRIIIPGQTHSTVCAVIPPAGDIPPLQGVDALVTRRRHTIIGVNTADCLPLFLVHPAGGVIAVAHAGWRGAVGGIVENTLRAMAGEMAAAGFDTGDFSEIRAAIGPHICTECFEVGPEVAARFGAEAVERRPEWPRPHVSLAAHVQRVLVEAGVRPENIAPWSRGLCTRCHPANFFSARRLGIASGRTFTFAYLD